MFLKRRRQYVLNEVTRYCEIAPRFIGVKWLDYEADCSWVSSLWERVQFVLVERGNPSSKRIPFALRLETDFSLVILVNWPSIRLMPYFRVADKLHEQITKNTSSRLSNWRLLKELVTGQRVFVAVRMRTREILQPALSLCLGAHSYELC